MKTVQSLCPSYVPDVPSGHLAEGVLWRSPGTLWWTDPPRRREIRLWWHRHPGFTGREQVYEQRTPNESWPQEKEPSEFHSAASGLLQDKACSDAPCAGRPFGPPLIQLSYQNGLGSGASCNPLVKGHVLQRPLCIPALVPLTESKGKPSPESSLPRDFSSLLHSHWQ